MGWGPRMGMGSLMGGRPSQREAAGGVSGKRSGHFTDSLVLLRPSPAKGEELCFAWGTGWEIFSHRSLRGIQSLPPRAFGGWTCSAHHCQGRAAPAPALPSPSG